MSDREKMMVSYAVIFATKGADSPETKAIRQALVIQVGEDTAAEVEALVRYI